MECVLDGRNCQSSGGYRTNNLSAFYVFADQTKHENNNIPDILALWRDLETEASRTRTDQSFFVPRSEIAANDYDLSINRYKEVVYAETNHDSPQDILRELEALENEIQADLKALEAMIG